MKIFVSHSMKDKTLLMNLRNSLEPYGITLFIAEHYFEMQSTVSDKIREMIKNCDVGLVLLTSEGFNSGFVREEIGSLDTLNKPIVLVMEKGLETKYSGFLYGHDFISLDKNYPITGVEKIKDILLNHWQNLIDQENKMKQLEEEEQIRRNRSFLFGLGILAGIIFLGSNN